MADQAKILRGLMQRQPSAVAAEALPAGHARARSITITSGKGGVGKSNIALNLAVALAETGASVCLLDANNGVGNIDLLCGLNGYWNLSHVISGARTLKDVVLPGPHGIHVIPGASGLNDIAELTPSVQREILHQLEDFERTHDFLIIDVGTGLYRAARDLVFASDVVLVITTPEPTSVADAYATIKSLSTRESLNVEALVNQADSNEQARLILERLRQTARLFLHTHVSSAGSIPRDPHVGDAVLRRRPFLDEYPHCPASTAVRRLARRLSNTSEQRAPQPAFFPTACQSSDRGDAA